MRFTYRSGQKPLDGFTIKRGVGQGGFGEVYFAVSDGGKEVALKLLKSHTDVELRGAANCLNLKHPNLVHVYDIREDADGATWLVMEYVLGESLAQVINRHPTGLPANMAREWLLSLTRAVGYLHDHGVLHRDLKPANIFIESGTLKVGDFGLCKSLHSNQRQTRTVGTFHYMAPEVSGGVYGKPADLYACAIILYEMLTGQLPFDGESDAEILMKHATTPPDLGRVPPGFRAVLSKALDKNPARRFATAAELARAVEAASMPVPMATPVVSPPVAKPVPPPAAPPLPPKPAVPVATPLPVPPGLKLPAPALAQAKPVATQSVRDRLTDLTGSMLAVPLVAAVGLIPAAVVASSADHATVGKLFLLTTAVGWAMLVGSSGATYRNGGGWGRRLRLAALGGLVGVAAFWLDGWTLPKVAADAVPSAAETYAFGAVQMAPETVSAGLKYMLYFAGVLGAGRWWRATARDRKDRFSLFPAVAAGFWGLLLCFLWPWQAGAVWAGVVPVALAAVAVQAVSPWTPPPPPASKKLRYRSA